MAADVFEGGEVRRLKIEIPQPALETLRKYHWQFGQQVEREVVQVTVREGQNVYTNVALHLKGAAGSFRGFDDNPALTLNFDRFAKGQHFHGVTKFSLNNSVQDPTYVSEKVSRELFLMAGVPTPRACHAVVELNGRDLGLYVLVEGWGKEFLKRHFKNTKGNLYDGGFLKEVTDELSTNAGEDPQNQSDRIALAEAAKEKDLAKRLAALEKILDIERFLSFVALDVMLWDWDGYAMNRNNWRLYHDRDTGRMIFMPHGMDQMFWNPTGSVLPPMQGLVAKAVLEIPALRTRYFDKIKQLRGSVFDPVAMTNRVHQIAASFTPLLKEKYPKVAADQEKALADFCGAIIRRGQSLDEQLAQPIEPAAFDTQGYAKLSGWQSKQDFGFPQLTQTAGDGAEAALAIGTRQGSSIGSWRTKVWLEKGDYRLVGRLKIQGLVADPGDPRGGAGVRTGQSRPEKYRLGDSDWQPLDYSFKVNDALMQVQIVCEFRGAEGQAWFDLHSLRIKVEPNGQ